MKRNRGVWVFVDTTGRICARITKKGDLTYAELLSPNGKVIKLGFYIDIEYAKQAVVKGLT
jgi:hypothetical protein